MGKYCFLVFSNPVAGKDDEYNQWYNEQHLPDVLKVPGFTAAQRFKAPEQSGLPARYVAIYEMETEDPQAVLAELNRRAGTPDMVLSDALDASGVTFALCPAISERVTAIRR